MLKLRDRVEAPVPVVKRRRWVRPARRAALGLVVALALYYLFNLASVWWVGQSDQKRAVDAIVVMGAAQYDGRPSPLLAARLDHALELFQERYAPLIVVTGGKQPGDRFTEARTSAAYLTARGVPAAAILEDDQGRTSYESLAAAARLLERRGSRSVLLVSDPFHSLRIRGTAGELGLSAYVSATRTSPIKGFTAFRRMLKEAAGVSYARMFGYDRLGSLDPPSSQEPN